MSTINFAFCLHNHQPVGNMHEIFEEAYQTSYKPFIDVLEKYGDIKLNLHYTGILLDWLAEHHLDFINRLAVLVNRGQLEILTGGHYEPIMPVIPEVDRLGQIAKLTNRLKDTIGSEPRGMWLAERVWEPQLPSTLSRASVEYVVIDDEHFKNAGCREEDTFRMFITEDQGETVKIFPSNTHLRDMMPFRTPEENINFLLNHTVPDGKRLLVMGDDGEKFGLWPGTYNSVYKERWLERFFEKVLENKDRIKMRTFSECLDDPNIPISKMYLPTASYMEMSRWVLAPEQAYLFDEIRDGMNSRGEWERHKTMVHGGFWRNFFLKYPESDFMHKKMLYVSRKLTDAADSIAKETLAEAQNELWQGQCNCPYWHGVFGGLYLPHLRAANYQHMINAEKIVDSALNKRKDWIDIKSEDISKSGTNDFLILSHVYTLCFSALKGGMLYELDYRPKSLNILDSMSRRPEIYHKNISQDEIKYDWYLRKSFIVHFFPEETSLSRFKDCEYNELGDFVDQAFEAKMTKSKTKATLTLSRLGGIWQGGHHLPLEVTKVVSLEGGSEEIKLLIKLENKSNETLSFCFGLEMNFSMLTGSAPDRFFEFPGHTLRNNKSGSIGTVTDVDIMTLKDTWRKVCVWLRLSKKATFWRFPIETLSQKIEGYDRNYQSTVVVPFWRVSLPPGKTWDVNMVKGMEML